MPPTGPSLDASFINSLQPSFVVISEVLMMTLVPYDSQILIKINLNFNEFFEFKFLTHLIL